MEAEAGAAVVVVAGRGGESLLFNSGIGPFFLSIYRPKGSSGIYRCLLGLVWWIEDSVEGMQRSYSLLDTWTTILARDPANRRKKKK